MAPNRQLTIARESIADASTRAEDMLEKLGIPREVFERVATNALLQNPQLAKCDPNSVFKACMLAAQHGLLPDGRSCALVPLKKKGGGLEAHMWPMIGGLLTKVRENLKNITLRADSVYQDSEGEGDVWEDIRGTHPDLTHKPDRHVPRTTENLVCVYATAFHPNNPVPEFEVLYKSEIEEFRKLSRAQRGPWATHYAEMAEVRVLKRLLKRLPVNPTLHAMIANETEDGEDDFEYEDDDGVIDHAQDGEATSQASQAAPARGSDKARTKAKPAPEEEPEEEAPPADDEGDADGGDMDPTVRF